MSDIFNLIFQYKSPVHLKCYILIQTSFQLDNDMNNSLKLENNVKQKNLTPSQACKAKSL